MYSRYSSEKPWFAARWYAPCSRRKMNAHSAAHRRAADCTSVSSTACRSKVGAADDVEHVRGRSLLLQRVAQLVEQPRVLDRDHGLIGKSRHQLDLFRGKWLRSGLRHEDHPDDISLAQEWGAERSAIAADLLCPGPGIVRVRQHVGHMNHPAL